jgi:hypothetical protein
MPLELLPENQKVRAAFWQDQALGLIVRIKADTYLHQKLSLLLVYSD